VPSDVKDGFKCSTRKLSAAAELILSETNFSLGKADNAVNSFRNEAISTSRSLMNSLLIAMCLHLKSLKLLQSFSGKGLKNVTEVRSFSQDYHFVISSECFRGLVNASSFDSLKLKD
jgi:hypothetical protein